MNRIRTVPMLGAAVFCFGVGFIPPTGPAAALRVRSVQANGAAVLKINMVRGYVTVYINGTQVGRYGQKDVLAQTRSGIVSVDIGSYIKPGSNTIRVTWSETKTPLGDLHVSYADTPGKYRQLSSITFDVNAKASGSRTATFVIPTSLKSVGQGVGEKTAPASPADTNAPSTNKDKSPPERTRTKHC